MDTLIIEITNLKAYKLLQCMEELNLIRVLRKPEKLSSLRQKIKVRMSNSDIDNQLNTIRNECKRDI